MTKQLKRAGMILIFMFVLTAPAWAGTDYSSNRSMGQARGRQRGRGRHR
jgi:hypothetical protein